VPAVRTALAMWTVGLVLYVLAVFHRSSLAVASLVAADRFDIEASQLATFAVLQLVVYAAMQVPVGLLVDRFGYRSVLLSGAVLLAGGQVAFALADGFAVALAARALVGLGDAMSFLCVVRLVAEWFPARRVPLITQLTTMLGQLGTVAAAIPMTWALAAVGWTVAYLATASVGLVVVVLGLVVLQDAPGTRHVRGAALSAGAVWVSVRASWAEPGTRLGFWIHFTAQASATTLSLLWGYPFLVRGEGRSSGEAGVLLTLLVVAAFVSGPLLGWLVTRHPWQRSSMVLGVVVAMVTAWTVVLIWPGPAPLALLVVLVLAVGVGGPAAAIGFDVGRTANPAERLASATGIINVAGFVASLALVGLIGLVLDWQTSGGADPSPGAFTWAMSVQYLVWGLGSVQIWRCRVASRRALVRAGRAPHLVSAAPTRRSKN
jgi:MFS family permease